MAELKQLDFYLLRYMPNAVKGEFVNIGLVMIEAGEGGFAEVRFTQDLRPAERLDPQIDTEMLLAVERHVQQQFQDPARRQTLLRKMEDSFSNLIQMSPRSIVLAEEPAKEMEALASFYFKVVHQPVQRIPTGRTRIWQQMRAAFEHERILKALMTDIAMEKYTEAGDPLKLDFAYTVREELKVFQAVSLIGKLDQAKLFGFRATGIVTSLAKHTGVVPLLTAVVDDDWDRNNSEAKFAVNTMKENRVEVASVADMPKIAELARIELRL
jgi:Protein of unknown function (DUF3037)